MNKRHQITLSRWDLLAILPAVQSHASTSRSAEDAKTETSAQIVTIVYGRVVYGAAIAGDD